MKKSILKSTALVLCAGLVCCLLLTAAIFDAKTTQQTETQLRSLATARAPPMTRTATPTRRRRSFRGRSAGFA